MIYKRFAANLRAQNWSAIVIELGIVIVGVFIGTLVANANQQRLEGAEAGYRLKQLKPELQRIRARADIARRYYATTRRYAETAFAAWEGDPNRSATTTSSSPPIRRARSRGWFRRARVGRQLLAPTSCATSTIRPFENRCCA